MTKICRPCNWPMIVIKATTGILELGQTTPPEDPIIFYKCPKCGKLIERSIIKIQGTAKLIAEENQKSKPRIKK